MKIILLDKIENLGNKNDLVEVKSGYVRNFLICKKSKYYVNYNLIKNKKIKLDNNYNNNIYKYDFKKMYEDILKIKNIIFYKKSNKNGKLFDSVNKKNIINYIISNISYCKSKFIKVFLNKNIKNIGNFYIKISINNTYFINMNIIIKNK
ncbi:50S ribosomal protein L9 [endosymbiont of Pachyrhynchus infernalis]|uniref:50S ribosomal protein L9 n=1 Tax=endosymbiont of Pachyrhynchus infernalis TaxID=1971488 RepID=UPI000DC6DC66|nr:50S ribosomal protein L9 [endosymbiont of Pachyrhynchus infernalis]BBA84932.1 50S ribosomal protein L9 [endosymbiont of Pachyrhynchus infernalis]